MKGMGKYFVGLLPPPAVESQFNTLKQGIATQFQVKYALQAPAHLTLKMPFRYKEAKERELGFGSGLYWRNRDHFNSNLQVLGILGIEISTKKLRLLNPYYPFKRVYVPFVKDRCTWWRNSVIGTFKPT
jgi:hypothetical protein